MALTNLVTFLGLSEGPDHWAGIILRTAGRKCVKDIIRVVSEKGYDIAVESELLAERYFELMGEACRN
jgi:hypothetical protein